MEMNVLNPVGGSRVTQLKWEVFSYVIAKHAEMVREIFKEQPRMVIPAYLYIDLYAGPGLYEARHNAELIGQIGSPLIALRRLKLAGIECVPYLADASREVCDQLRTSLLRDGYAEHVGRVVNACCAETVDRLLCWHTSKNKYGMIFVDPNGAPDWDAVRLLSKSDKWYCVDMMINLNSTAHKRTRNRFKDQGFKRPTEYLKTLRRRYIYLLEVTENDPWQFTLAYCTNHKRPDLKRYPFHNLDSEKGREIARLIDYPEWERDAVAVPDSGVTS